MYRNYALEDAKERFSEFDINGDGVVTWEEYNSVAHDQLISLEDTVLEDPEQESLRKVGKLFKCTLLSYHLAAL